MKETFKDDGNFFKSNELDGNGKLLKKTIPTVEKKTVDSDFFKSFEQEEDGILKSIPTIEKKTVKKEITVSTGERTKPTKQITAFKKKIEDAFKCIDGVISDLVKDLDTSDSSYRTQRCTEMLLAYKKFKNDFQYSVNDKINYPRTKNEDKIENDWDKTRIRI